MVPSSTTPCSPNAFDRLGKSRVRKPLGIDQLGNDLIDHGVSSANRPDAVQDRLDRIGRHPGFDRQRRVRIPRNSPGCGAPRSGISPTRTMPAAANSQPDVQTDGTGEARRRINSWNGPPNRPPLAGDDLVMNLLLQLGHHGEGYLAVSADQSFLILRSMTPGRFNHNAEPPRRLKHDVTRRPRLQRFDLEESRVSGPWCNYQLIPIALGTPSVFGKGQPAVQQEDRMVNFSVDKIRLPKVTRERAAALGFGLGRRSLYRRWFGPKTRHLRHRHRKR